MKQTAFFQCLSDETRLRALLLLAREGELCVCELMHALDQPQPKMSRHMAIMKEGGMLKARRHAQWVFYSLNPALEPWQGQIIEAVVAGSLCDLTAKKDLKRLAAMTNRPTRCDPA